MSDVNYVYVKGQGWVREPVTVLPRPPITPILISYYARTACTQHGDYSKLRELYAEHFPAYVRSDGTLFDRETNSDLCDTSACGICTARMCKALEEFTR